MRLLSNLFSDATENLRWGTNVENINAKIKRKYHMRIKIWESFQFAGKSEREQEQSGLLKNVLFALFNVHMTLQVLMM